MKQREPMGNISFAILVIGLAFALFQIVDIATHFPRQSDIGAILLDLVALAFFFTAAWVLRRLP